MSATKGLSLAQVCFRRFSQSAVRRSAGSDVTEVPNPRFARLKEKQKAMQIDDGKPVHEKGGTGDRILYGITTMLVMIGLGMSGEVLWKLTFKDA